MLTLHYLAEDEWHGELRVKAQHAGFSGKASAWLNREDIRKFAADLRAVADDHIVAARLRAGYFSESTTRSAPVETHIGICVARQNRRHVALIELADPGEAILPQRVQLQLSMEWAALHWNATSIEAMIDGTGIAELKFSPDATAEPAVVKARYPISRPYTPLVIALREECSALIQQMEQAAWVVSCPPGKRLVAEEWEAYDPGLMIADVDWEGARIVCRWGRDFDDPTTAERSPNYILDLTALKSEALASEHPRAYFESHAAYVLYVAQGYLIDFYRDGPTDDIPFERHLLFVRGLQGCPAQIRVSNILFSFDESRK